jgi:hypothetical protein
MARHLEADREKGKGPAGRQEYINALIHHRRPRPVDDGMLLKRIESKTAQHRTPYSANISRKHASILAAMSPEDRSAPKLGHHRTMTPTREASVRKAFEVFEWEREREPLSPEAMGELPISPPDDPFPGDTEPRPALPKYMASIKSDEPPTGPEEAYHEPAPEAEPEMVAEAVDDWEEGMLEDAKALLAAATPSDEEVEEEAPTTGPEEDEAVPEPETPQPIPPDEEVDDMVVEGIPGQPPRSGGEFPIDMMEPLEDAETDDSAGPDTPRRDEEDEVPVLSYSHEMDISDDQEASPGETETEESVVGLGHGTRWPSDTGLELHIDGFEHISAASDLCPRCGRRIAARNRLLTCNDCGTVACESCEIKTSAKVDAPYYYDWRFELPLCVNCYDKAFNIQKMLAKAKASLGMGNHTYAFYHAQQALRIDPGSPYAKDAQRIIDQVDKRRRESAEQDEAWKRQRAKLSRTTVVHED